MIAQKALVYPVFKRWIRVKIIQQFTVHINRAIATAKHERSSSFGIINLEVKLNAATVLIE